MNPVPQGHRRAFALVEMLAVMAVIAILLGLGYSVYRGARVAARVAIAENNLKQVATALELYLRKYGHYPPQGADLVEELTPFVGNPEVFTNPLIDEKVPGETLTNNYFPPTLSEGDTTKWYITAFTSDDGHTAVVLYTGSQIEVPTSITYIPKNPGNFIHVVTGLDVISGPLNLDPRNNTNFDFTLVSPSGAKITRSDLLGSNGQITFSGRVQCVITWPKGTGNQNYIQVNGQPFQMVNGRLYTIAPTPQGGRLNVLLCNVNVDPDLIKVPTSESMGAWWINVLCIGGTISPSK